MPNSCPLMPERHEAVGYHAEMDLDLRRLRYALAYSKHRTMPELDEFAKLATSMLGNGGTNESAPAPTPCTDLSVA
jgi:hypothetical protein